MGACVNGPHILNLQEFLPFDLSLMGDFMLIRIPEYHNKVYNPLHVVGVHWSKTERYGWWDKHRIVNFFRRLVALKPLEPTWVNDEWHQYKPCVYVKYSSDNSDYIYFEMGEDEKAEACYQRIIGEVNEFFETSGIKNPLTA